MSIAIMTAVWDSGKLRGPALLTMLAIADHANNDGLCWPSIPTLARRTRQSERNARRNVSRLETLGALRREQRTGTSNLLRVNLDFFAGADGFDTPDNSDRADETDTPDKAVSWEGGQPCPPGADKAMSGEGGQSYDRLIINKSSNETSIEPSLNLSGASAAPAIPASASKPAQVLRSKAKRGTRIPADFAVKDEHRALGKGLGVDADAECPAFIDHYQAKAGAGAVMLDWDAAFRNWLRNAVKFGGNGTRSGAGGNGRKPTEPDYRKLDYKASEQTADWAREV